MRTESVTLTPDETLQQVAVVFYQHQIDGAPVVGRDGRMMGVITRTHLVKALATGCLQQTAEMVMDRDVLIIDEEMTVEELQREDKIYSQIFFPVINKDSQPIGFVTRTDLLKYLSERSAFLGDELRAVLDSVHNGVIATNGEGIVTIFNPAAERITGIVASQVIGEQVDNVIPNTALKRVLETGVTELNKKQTIGRSQILTTRSPIVKNHKNVGAVAVFQDITQLQTVAAELEYVKNLKSTLESILESLFDCIVVVDKSGRITMLNHAYSELLGADPQEAIGKHVSDVIPNTRMHIVAQTGKAETAEVQRIGENQCIVTRIPIIKDGEVVGAVGKVMFKDIKDFKILARKLNTLQSELEYYKEELRKVHGGKYNFDDINGSSEMMQHLKSVARRASKGSSTVLILGESGTGKELFAHAIHNTSIRKHGPFIKINCAAIPENLLESELFGYEEGAFTGARKGGKPGKFELANGGTIFLDEIGDMTMSMQAKLLRVLQEREFERVGATKTQKVDVRVIAATHQDLETMIEQGKFRKDLYYRLNIISLNIPPLRERKEDIAVLAEALLKKINQHVHHWVEGIAYDAMNLLLQYDWPGNVRELENVLERAVNLMDEETWILPEHLPPLLKKQKMNKLKEKTEDVQILAGIRSDAEKQAIHRALEAAGGNKSKAAKILGIHRSGFYQKLKRYNIE